MNFGGMGKRFGKLGAETKKPGGSPPPTPSEPIPVVI